MVGRVIIGIGMVVVAPGGRGHLGPGRAGKEGGIDRDIDMVG